MPSDHDTPTRANIAVSGHNFHLEDVTVSNLFDVGAKKGKPKKAPPAPPPAPVVGPRLSAEQAPWECGWAGCFGKGRWWRSILGVVNCLDCHPPSFPQLVAEDGGPENTPMVPREIAFHGTWVDDPETYLGDA